MREQGGEAGSPFWTDGDMLLRVQGTGRESDRIVKVRRPFAIVGQDQGCDVVIADRAVNERHAYLHLDPRGLYVVDLVTRTGTRIEEASQMVGWIRPGQALEVAGRRIELLRMRIDGEVVEPPPCDDDMLIEQGQSSLISLTLDPERTAEDPWVLGSELVFLGWSSACGIPIKGTTVARVHCAIVRTLSAAFVVDLCGHHTWVDDRPVRGASELVDGGLLTVGPARFTTHVGPDQEAPFTPTDHLPARVDDVPSTAVSSRPAQGGSLETAGAVDAVLLPTVEAMPAESTQALLAWMMGAIQGGQGEVLRQQGEFQLAMTQLIRQMQQDNAALLGAHLNRIESIDRELAALRSELVRRNGEPVQPSLPIPAPTPPPPSVAPLKIKRPEPGQPAPVDSKASTTWLLERVSQLENENRSAWRDLLGRLSTTPKR